MNLLRPAAPAGLLALMMLAGCETSAPTYARPEVSLPQSFRDAPSAAVAGSFADQPWWVAFDDPALHGLVSQALANNYDLQGAVARIAQARALVGVAGSQASPQVNYGAFTRGEEAFVPNPVGDPDSIGVGSLGGVIDAAWEFDVWGRIRHTTEAAQANLMEQEEIRRGILLTLTSDVAAGYFRLLELDRELAIATESAGVFSETAQLFNARFEAGRDSLLPVERARANTEQAQSRIQNIRREIALQENAISVLMGVHPGPIPRGRPLGQQTLPQTPLGATTDLLQRRPDIRAAEQAMIRANAEVGVAIANKFPKIGLSSLLGLTGATISGNSNAFGLGNIGLGLAGPLFDGGRLQELYNNRKAYWDEQVAGYRKVSLVAMRETSDALAAQNTLAQRRLALERQVQALRQSAELARTRYDNGRASYFEVLEAQQQLFPAEDALAQTQRDQLLAVVSLYKALGGGWNLSPDQWNRPQQVAASGDPS